VSLAEQLTDISDAENAKKTRKTRARRAQSSDESENENYISQKKFKERRETPSKISNSSVYPGFPTSGIRSPLTTITNTGKYMYS